MKYDNITPAVFINRPNRFIADVEINGKRETVHVKNTGRCRELLLPGTRVFLTAPGSPGRKTKYDLVSVLKNGKALINIDSQAPNRVVMEWLETKGFTKIIPEYTYGDSRIDFYMEKILPSGETIRYLTEVKGCTLEINGMGYFPDAPTKRGTKHLRELIKAVKEGYRSCIVFVIQMEGVFEVKPNTDTDPDFAKAFEDAKNQGVEILFLPCSVESDSISVNTEQSLNI